MGRAFAPFSVPRDLQPSFAGDRLPVAEDKYKRDGSLRRCQPVDTSDPVPAFSNQANLSLLWHSYLPARDVSGPLDNSRTDWGIDFSNLRDKNPSNWKTCAQSWASFGTIQWFTRQAGAITSCPEFAGHLALLHHRRRTALERLGPLTFLSVRSVLRIAMGLGNPSVFENGGLAFQDTYGFPVLPGASLKGLARHFLVEEYPSDPPNTAPDEESRLLPQGSDADHVATLLFGTGSGEEDETGEEGALTFHDGWPLASENDEGWFEVDVLTPHHRKYYGAEKNPPPPGDNDPPNPIHFLTVREGVPFEIPVTLSLPGRALEPQMQMDVLAMGRMLLICALDRWGAGSRTGAGYGRFLPDLSRS